jgi:NADH-quinone oxidoreductase subunit J
MIAILMGNFFLPSGVVSSEIQASTSNTKELGIVMYSQYIYPLEVATAILLVAVIAAIGLTMRHRKDTKRIDPSDQVRVRASERLIVLKQEVVVKSNANDSSLANTVKAEKDLS